MPNPILPPRGNVITKLFDLVVRAVVIRGHAQEIGPSGAFLVRCIDIELDAAREALTSGCPVAMINCCKRLIDIQE